ncbi:MAG: response regulator [Sediminibacterium sp.]|nr:response regulator [Sediminibacterium sp.]
MIERELMILLADDDADDCLLFKEALDELSVPVRLTTVHNGEQLMLLLNKNEMQHDILFLDLNMPRKNGFDCLSEIRQNKKLDGLAVIPISTSFELEMVNLLYKNGAQHYIRKPNEFSQLKHLIQDGITIVAETHTAQALKEGFVLLGES